MLEHELAVPPFPDDLGTKALHHVNKLVSYGERRPGSPPPPGRAKGIDHICAQLDKIGLPATKDTWTEQDLQFTNIAVSLPGTEDADKVVIGCHHDTKNCFAPGGPDFAYVGANDSGSGVGLLLELGRALQAVPHAAHYELVFFDGEESLDWEWNPARALFGSSRYVARYQAGAKSPPIRAFILLDMVGAKDVALDIESGSDVRLKLLFSNTAGPGLFENPSLSGDDDAPFQDAQIPTMNLSGQIQYEDRLHFWHTAHDTPDKLAAASLQRVGEVVLGALPQVCASVAI